MISLWWLALPVLVLPVWWHRQKRERAAAQPLATARFLPRTNPLHRRIWRWADRWLLLVRCLLLVAVIAWLADLVVPWRGNSVLIALGTNTAWAEQQMKETGFANASRIALPSKDAFGWLARHEREWQSGARLLLLGDVTMPAAKPALAHALTVRTRPAAVPKSEHRVAIVSKRAEKWRALFAAVDGPQRYVIDSMPGAASELIVWDMPEAPPPQLRAPLWWIGDASAFPELKNAARADSPRGRLWAVAAPADADAARALFESWQRLHYPPVAYPAPAQQIAAAPAAALARTSGALRYLLTLALLALFAIERILSHAKRR